MPQAAPPQLPSAAAVSPRLVTAHLRKLRRSPRKLRLVCQTVVGMPAVAAINYLKLLPQAAAKPVAKLVASAVANAGHNYQIAKEDLPVKELLVNQGPTLKRFHPRAFGRAGTIRRRSSHLTVRLLERPGATRLRPGTAAAAVEPPPTVTLEELQRGLGSGPASGAGKAAATASSAAKGGGFRRKLFQRKAG